MSDFAGGSREKTIVFGILAVLVVVLVVLAQQLLSGQDDGEAASPAEASAGSGGNGGGGEPVGDVMALMPYSEAELEAAAETARAFVAAYSEVDPGESDDERLARLSPLLSEDFFGAVEEFVLSTPNSGASRGTPRRVTAEATATAIRNVGSGSVIVEVEARFMTETGDDGGTEPASYAVTVVPGGEGWAVYAFQDAAVGNIAEEGA
ncbi:MULTISPECIES: hypothetical protein [Nocardiopsidaceae]|uniref:Conjugal transfer protein n=1 Tax=Streptomonospora nanhaiensis TaxID=1323731 RepID=A0ABY6YNS0_9ACTN|nr:hypothetical protein [Streptomonospora nanhaiensis]WAE73903.1 hypothetical protein OUQ99_01890 [Streptomonospora nanhaiensis]